MSSCKPLFLPIDGTGEKERGETTGDLVLAHRVSLARFDFRTNRACVEDGARNCSYNLLSLMVFEKCLSTLCE